MTCTKKKMALICDPLELFKDPAKAGLPADASAEWESPSTVAKFVETWTELGFEVETLSPSRDFFETWAKNFREYDLVHSVVEGWGSLGREAWIPALCELSGVPFIGTGSFGMAAAMKKSLVKAACQSLGIPTARFVTVTKIDELNRAPKDFFERPHFIKPDCEGSGMGVDANHSLSVSLEKTKQVVESLLLRFPEGVLIEELLEGQEVTTGLLGSEFLPVAEIEVPTGVYGLANKSKDYMGEKVTFVQLAKRDHEHLERCTRALADVLECRDFVRMDFKKHGDAFYFLEANPLAGLSFHYSVFPKMAEAAGYTYVTLFEKLAALATERTATSRSLRYGATVRERNFHI